MKGSLLTETFFFFLFYLGSKVEASISWDFPIDQRSQSEQRELVPNVSSKSLKIGMRRASRFLFSEPRDSGL